jgi:hypothetical protein
MYIKSLFSSFFTFYNLDFNILLYIYYYILLSYKLYFRLLLLFIYRSFLGFFYKRKVESSLLYLLSYINSLYY